MIITSISNLVKFFPILIKEEEATNAVRVVDGDRSDPVDCISWNHEGMVSWITLISLSRSGTIGQDKVKKITTTRLPVLKANECMKQSAPSSHHSFRGKHKMFGASSWSNAYCFWKYDRGKYYHNCLLLPLGHSLVKNPIDSLQQLDHFPVAEAQGDFPKALGKSESIAQLSQSFSHLCKLLAGCHLWIGFSLNSPWFYEFLDSFSKA
jgi:hypothetical protein